MATTSASARYLRPDLSCSADAHRIARCTVPGVRRSTSTLEIQMVIAHKGMLPNGEAAYEFHASHAA
jgi:hypothetical protein